jgi:hypothetical protein
VFFNADVDATTRKYYVFVDMECVPAVPKDFMDGLQIVFALHFIFNIKYHQDGARLFIFMENFFLGHITPQNRGEKTDEFKLGLVHTLITAITKFINKDKALKCAN